MRRALAAALLLAAGAARAASWRASERLIPGSRGYLGSDLEVGVRSASGRWDGAFREKAFRFGGAFPGGVAELSARVARNLPHVSIAARLGTAPPNAQRAAYHLAQGEATLTAYGLALGPEDPASVAGVSEDTTTLRELSALDRTWVTRLRARFTSTNHHQQPPRASLKGLDVVQNSWQFSLSETWRERASVALDAGQERYNRVMARTDPTWYLWNVDHAGAPLAIRGWPNTHVGLELEARRGAFSAGAAFTRINMLDGAIEALWSVTARWAPRPGWELSFGHAHRRRLGQETVEAWPLSVSARW